MDNLYKAGKKKRRRGAEIDEGGPRDASSSLTNTVPLSQLPEKHGEHSALLVDSGRSFFLIELKEAKMPVSVTTACSNFGRPEDLSQSQKMRAEVPYVHPLVRRSSSLLSQKSLEVCTESLGSETGSDGFSPAIDGLGFEEAEGGNNGVGDEEAVPAAPVSYHGRKTPLRSFPPPLPSISQRHVPCLHMRPHRVGGRLVVEAVAVPSANYLQAHRADGRLVLSLAKASVDDSGAIDAKVEGNRGGAQDVEIVETEDQYGEEEVEEEEEEEEEEVEVVDRGTVVEVKVSTQPQQQSGAVKIHRSSLVINKFLGGTPLSASAAADERPRGAAPINSTAAAAAVVAASSTVSEGYNYNSGPPDVSNGGSGGHLLLFTSKRRNRDELLHNVRRCSQLRSRPLFIWEPCCIATLT